MTTSPFPNIKYGKYENYLRIILRKLSQGKLFNPIRADYYENPCLYVEEDNQGNIPSKFKLLSQHPLMECPDDYYGLPSYNSDPDIFVEDDVAYILNRAVFPTSTDYTDPENPYPAIVRIYLIKGKLTQSNFIYESTNLIKEWSMPYASPCMAKYKDRYILTYINSNSANDGVSFDGIYIGFAESPEGFAQNIKFRKIRFDDTCWLPWHMSLFHYKDKLYTIIACVEKGKKEKIWQLLGEFEEDLSELRLFPRPLTDYNSYRSSAIVDGEDNLILYEATLYEKIKKSNSVDGRNILVAAKSMEDLISMIKLKE